MADCEHGIENIIRQTVEYDLETGIFRWKNRPVEMFNEDGRGGRKGNAARWNSRFAGKQINNKNADGYIQICILGKFYMASRVAWFLVNGEWPDCEIDHINGEVSDNRLINLRQATRSLNCANRSILKSNTSGHKGVGWHKAVNKWVAKIGVDGKEIYLGAFSSKDDAIAAYTTAAQKYFGEFVRK